MALEHGEASLESSRSRAWKGCGNMPDIAEFTLNLDFRGVTSLALCSELQRSAKSATRVPPVR